MTTFSIIIPAYKGDAYLGDAIQSVLSQTDPNFELIIVDDHSPDRTQEVVRQFNDPRIKYIRHEKNLGVVKARETGLEHAKGDLIGFLDQDDRYHPEKLSEHAKKIHQCPELGFLYNARFELDYSADTIREIWRPPAEITLPDLVLGFPIAPSDIVLKRDWALRMTRQYKPPSWTGGEIVRYSGLFLDGCKFGLVDRALNYRRHHSGRVIKDLIGGCESEIACQELVFNDSRCPAEVLALRPIAHSNLYAFWAFRAFRQGEPEIGCQLIRKALHWNPSIAKGAPSELLNLWVINGIDDENLDHEALFRNTFNQMPCELKWGELELTWAVNRAYLLKGFRNLMWNRFEKGAAYLVEAAKRNAKLDHRLELHLAQWLLDYSKEFGPEAAKHVLQNWCEVSKKYFKDNHFQRHLSSGFYANLAMESYKNYKPDKAMRWALSTIKRDPTYVMNRGIQSIMLHSFISNIHRSKKQTI